VSVLRHGLTRANALVIVLFVGGCGRAKESFVRDLSAIVREASQRAEVPGLPGHPSTHRPRAGGLHARTFLAPFLGAPAVDRCTGSVDLYGASSLAFKVGVRVRC
jgi:hypothetical protein